MSVIGTGYLGAVHAAVMAHLGHDVLGVDIDLARIDALTHGRPPFYEPEFADLLTAMVGTGRLRFSTSLKEAAQFADVHFLCVGTPQTAGSYAADLGPLTAVVDQMASLLGAKDLVVGKSTVPVGTAAQVSLRLRRPDGGSPIVMWNPEFLREGFAVADTLEPDRIVVGGQDPEGRRRLREIYAPMIAAGAGYIETDYETAELVKVAANSFLATKISFINAMAEVCEATGADVVTLADAIGADARIGSEFLRAGAGFGGGCLPKDIRAFIARADELGTGPSVKFLREIDAINTRARERVVAVASAMLGGEVAGRRIGVLGATFKPDSDDVRDSPALDVAARLHAAGAVVCIHDPRGLESAREAKPQLEYTYDVDKAFEDSDLVVHLTEWGDYRNLDVARLAAVTAQPVLLDARNALNVDAWRAGGWTVRSLGRPRR
ncbi:MAG: rkpK1 [Pseudonocardiales bacterium]|nr:rkpK1 [Pseudonocardiales bacterium]